MNRRTNFFACLCYGLFVLAVTAASAADNPTLVPQPRELQIGSLKTVRSAVVLTSGLDAEDMFTAKDLERTLAERGVHVAATTGKPDVAIRLLRACLRSMHSCWQQALVRSPRLVLLCRNEGG